jgi:hypothetical protein
MLVFFFFNNHFFFRDPGALTGGVEDVIHQKHIKQLGLNECTYGPGYWCSTLK